MSRAGVTRSATSRLDLEPETLQEWAARADDPAATITEIQALLNGGEKVDAVDGDGQSALMAAAKTHNLEVIKFLLEKGADASYAGGINNRTALIEACASAPASKRANAKIQTVRTLIGKTTDLDAQDADGHTALMALALRSSKRRATSESATLLMDAGAALDLRNKTGDMALTLAITGENEKLALDLVKRGSPLGAEAGGGDAPEQKHPLHAACEAGQAAVVTELLDAVRAAGFERACSALVPRRISAHGGPPPSVRAWTSTSWTPQGSTRPSTPSAKRRSCTRVGACTCSLR